MEQTHDGSIKDQEGLFDEFRIEELQEKLHALKGKEFFFDQEIQSFLTNFTSDAGNLVNFAKKILNILTGSQKSTQELEQTYLYLKELREIALKMDERFHSTEFFIKIYQLIETKSSLLANRHIYVTGLTDGFSLSGSHDHVSDSDMIKKYFYTLNAKEYIELGQVILKFTANLEISGKVRNATEVELIFNEVISIFLLIGKYFQPNVLYARKPEMLLGFEQKIKKFGQKLIAVDKYAKIFPLASKIQNHIEKLAQEYLEKEISYNKMVKIEGFLGRKEVIQDIERLCHDITQCVSSK